MNQSSTAAVSWQVLSAPELYQAEEYICSSGGHDMCRCGRLRRMQTFYLKWLARAATGDEKQDQCNNSQDHSRFHNISCQKHLAFSP
jgi:hypothetical protein